jgi:hypothetical protein
MVLSFLCRSMWPSQSPNRPRLICKKPLQFCADQCGLLIWRSCADQCGRLICASFAAKTKNCNCLFFFRHSPNRRQKNMKRHDLSFHSCNSNAMLACHRSSNSRRAHPDSWHLHQIPDVHFFHSGIFCIYLPDAAQGNVLLIQHGLSSAHWLKSFFLHQVLIVMDNIGLFDINKLTSMI